jgi:hypothetical protein
MTDENTSKANRGRGEERRGEMITLYHRTRSESAEVILREGFKAGIGTYITVNERTGV